MQERGSDNNRMEVILTPSILLSLKALSAVVKSLSVFFYTADRGNTAYKHISGRLNQKQEKLAVLCDYENFICWLEYTGVTACRLCVLPKHLDFLLHEDLWSRGNHIF